MNRYLVGPDITPALQAALRPHREAGRCLTFGPPGRADLVALADATWDDLVGQFPPGWQPDGLVLDLAYTRVPEVLWAAPVPVVGLAGDANLLWHAYRYLAPRCDLVLADVAGTERFTAAGLEHARPAFLYGSEPDYYEPSPDPAPRDIDILFVGNLHPAVGRDRHPWLARVAALADRWNVVIRTGVFGADYRELLRRAKIVFNWSIRGELNRRAVEAAAAGALLFQEAGNREAPAAFRDRQECVYYSPADLEALLEHYLRDDAERERIAAAGQSAAADLRADRAWERILAVVAENQSVLVRRAADRIANPPPPDFRGRLWAALGESVAAPDPALASALSAAASKPDRSAEVVNLLGVAITRDAAREARPDPSAVQAAATTFRQAVWADPTHPVARLNLAEALVVLDDRDEAQKELRALLGWLARDEAAADPTAWDAPRFPPVFDLFRVEWECAGWRHAGDADGLAAARRALVRWRANLLLADTGDALPDYYEAVVARPDLPVSRAALGCALARAEAFGPAAPHLRAAVAADPFDLGAARALFNVLSELDVPGESARLVDARRRLSRAAPQVVPPEPWFADEVSRPRVSLCMIVRNEERNLPDCLATVRDLVDEIVVVDTGSTDGTRDLAAAAGARVFEFPWCDDFAAARNESLRRATGDWIFWLDADDRLDAPARDELRQLFANLNAPTAFVMKCRCVAPRPGASETVVDHVRLFPNDARLRWRYRVHEQILPSVRAADIPVQWAPVEILHVGYTDAAIRRRKLDRDLRLLRREDNERPDDPFTLFNLGSVYSELGQPAVALPLLRRSLDRSDPQDSIVRKLYALVVEGERALGRRREALAACHEGRVIYPADPELLFVEALCHRDAGEPEQAEECLHKLLAEADGPHFGSVEAGLRGHKARHLLAALAFENGRLPQAREHWLAAVESVPEFTPGWLGLAEVALASEQWEEVRRLADRLRALGPGAAGEDDFLVGRMHLARGEFGPAKGAAAAAIAAAPTATAPRVLLSQVLLREGADLAAADQALRDVLALDPDHPEARHNLTLLHSHRIPT